MYLSSMRYMKESCNSHYSTVGEDGALQVCCTGTIDELSRIEYPSAKNSLHASKNYVPSIMGNLENMYV